MSDFVDRDAQIAALLRQAIEKTKARVRDYGWQPRDTAWHRAFGELAAYYSILRLIDGDPGPVPSLTEVTPAQPYPTENIEPGA